MFTFVSYDDPDKVTFIMNVDPLPEPANGFTQFPFDPDIRYSIEIDNNHDAIEDIRFNFQFKTDVMARISGKKSFDLMTVGDSDNPPLKNSRN